MVWIVSFYSGIIHKNSHSASMMTTSEECCHFRRFYTTTLDDKGLKSALLARK
jgi:hypothetical protein